MTSAHETTTECEQRKTTSPHDTAKGRNNSEELDNPVADMEETSSLSQASLATGDSFEEFTLSSVELNVLPGESFIDGDLGMFEKEKKDTDEGNVDVSINSVNDLNISRMSRSINEELLFEDNERYKEKEESISLTDNAVPESASTCSARGERVNNQKNRSVLEIGVQEQRDNATFHAGEKFRDPTVEDVRACCENVAEICLDTDEFEREIIGQEDDSFYDAVRSGNAKRVSALIVNGCVQNLNEPDWNVSGDPPLLMAATNHCLPVLR